jgi:hypothetical protein
MHHYAELVASLLFAATLVWFVLVVAHVRRTYGMPRHFLQFTGLILLATSLVYWVVLVVAHL